MSKKFLAGCSMVLLVAAQPGIAASIYTFSGQITSTSGVPASTYPASGVYLGAPITLQISLDSNKQGYSTQRSNGTKTYAPYEQTFGAISYQQQWTRFAELVSSNIGIGSSRDSNISYNQYVDATYTSPNSGSNYRGSITLGSYLSISKTTEYLDTRSFVENWLVGESLDLTLYFNTGSGALNARALVTLTSISNPLPSITPLTSVPIPGASLLFFSALAGIGGLKKLRSKRIAM